MNNQNLQTLKAKHKLDLEDYSQQVREYIDKYGNDNSEYLIYRHMLAEHHRGAYNALNELERMEEE